MNNRFILSLLFIANVCLAGDVASKQNSKDSFLRPVTAERSDSGYSIGGAVDGLIGTFWPDSLVRRWYELWNFWGWAGELDRRHYPQVYAMVGAACERMNVPMPDLYLMKNSETNAKLWMGKINAVVYGWSPRYAAITLTQDTLDLLTEEELQAYLTQAVGQIKDRHARLYHCLRDGIINCSPIFPIGALASGNVIPLLISLGGQAWLRTKIEEADRAAAHHLKNPEALASAITKENEEAGLPYKIGSSEILAYLNNWPTAAARLNVIAKVLKNRKD